MTVRLCYRTEYGVTTWWNNLFDEVYRNRTVEEIRPLLQTCIESYKGRLIVGPASEIEFETDEDATAFLLRWS